MASERKSLAPREPGAGVAELAGYGELLDDLKTRIHAARVRAALAVNREMILLYWQIGGRILVRQNQQRWGAKVIQRLSQDLSREFPDSSGFSSRNLAYMRAFAEAYPDEEFVQQAVAQIPWGHITLLLGKVKNAAEREWYVRQTVENGWSR
ncbi:MAG TPA: DUF1016 N-terminal domain-containing protein, partial [Longimicrobium sp.]|nr:DUF1016 N-terminal domain-containing protein [Longimicrobium sp.]